MPRNAFERVNFVATVEEGDFSHLGHASGVCELLGLKFIVVLSRLEKTFKEGAIRDPDFGSDFKFDFVEAFRFSHFI